MEFQQGISGGIKHIHSSRFGGERDREQDACPKIAQLIQKADTAQEASCLLFIKSLHFCAKET